MRLHWVACRLVAAVLLLPVLATPLLLAASCARAADSTPVEAIESIAAACNEGRYSDVGEQLHSSLRRTWMNIGYKVRDFCTMLTRDSTLRGVRIDKQEEHSEYRVVFVTYAFNGGAEQNDRATFLYERGGWKLAN